MMVLEMSELDFQCELKIARYPLSCIPLPSIVLITHPHCCRWSRGQTLVTEGEILSLGRNVRRSDAGEFTCRAANRHGETETQARDTDTVCKLGAVLSAVLRAILSQF